MLAKCKRDFYKKQIFSCNEHGEMCDVSRDQKQAVLILIPHAATNT